MRKLVALIFALLFAANSAARAAETPIAPRVDERLELVSIVFRLAGFDEFRSAPSSAYLKAVDAHFRPFAPHPITARLKAERERLRREGGDLGAWEAFALAMHVGPAPAFEPLFAIDKPPEGDGWDDRTLLNGETLALLRRFYKDARCAEFFAAQRPYFDAVDRSFVSGGYAIDARWFDDFYRVSPTETYRPILSLMGAGNFFYIRVNFGDGQRNTHTILAAGGFDAAGVPRKIDRNAVLKSSVHEHAHAFVNQLVDRRFEEFRGPAMRLLADPIVAERFKGAFYNEPRYLAYESIVRASQIMYFTTHGGDAKAKLIAEQERAGFLWMGGMVAKLEEYSKRRDAYPNLEAFMPEIVNYLSEAATTLEASRKKAR